jgi:hypothetical protein
VHLGISIKGGRYISIFDLITPNAKKALLTFHQLSTIGVNPKDFNNLLAFCFSAQIVQS